MVMSPLPLRKKRQMAPWLDVRYRGSKRRHCGDGRRLRPNRHVKHERFPSITFPAETMLETGMRFLFFQAAGGCKIPFLLVFFSANAKVAEYSSSRNCRSH